ncbi:MAG: hypothetical protein ABI579_08660 [Candidatus Sumerlaeota bacterium]
MAASGLVYADNGESNDGFGSNPRTDFLRRNNIHDPKQMGPLFFYSVSLYDTEGHAGLIDVFSVIDPRFYAVVGNEDGSTRVISGGLFPFRSAPTVGIPFWWEATTPWTGTVRGWAKSAYFGEETNFMLPAPASETGLQLFIHGETQGIMTTGIYVSLVDKLNTPSPIALSYFSGAGIPGVVTSVYLPGNVLSNSVGLESHAFGAFDLFGDRPGLYWGNYSQGGIDPSEAPFSRTIPVGPLLIAMTFEGSTTEMFETTGISSIYYEAHLPFAALPGSTIPTATQVLEIEEPPPWIMESTYNAVLLGDSIDLTTDLDTVCDRNNDGVIDAADRFAYSILEGGGKKQSRLTDETASPACAMPSSTRPAHPWSPPCY